MKSIAVLGEGVTASAVRQFLTLNHIQEVKPEDSETLVVSPGIPPENYPLVTGEIISEIEFAYRLLKEKHPSLPIIAITGTNGKSTVTSLIAHLLDVPAFGNIGRPLVEALTLTECPPFIVIEVSSYQLEGCFTFAPDMAVILNLSPDHLLRHHTLENYYGAKDRIFLFQDASQYLFYNAGDNPLCERVLKAPSQKVPVSRDTSLKLPDVLVGPHNAFNLTVATRICLQLGLSSSRIQERLSTFKPLAHRLEPVETTFPFKIYNDSKSTNIESTEVALKAFSQPVHLILCGENKGLDLNRLAALCVSEAVSVTVFGDIAEGIRDVIREQTTTFPMYSCETLSEALVSVTGKAKVGEVVLFSPSSSSYDQFKGFADRGDQFKAAITAL